MHKRIILSNLLKPYKVGDLIRLGSHKDGGYLLSKKSLSKSNFLISLREFEPTGRRSNGSATTRHCQKANIIRARSA